MTESFITDVHGHQFLLLQTRGLERRTFGIGTPADVHNMYYGRPSAKEVSGDRGGRRHSLDEKTEWFDGLYTRFDRLQIELCTQAAIDPARPEGAPRAAAIGLFTFEEVWAVSENTAPQNSNRPFLPASGSEPFFAAHAAKGSNSRFSFANTTNTEQRRVDSTGSSDFLPSVSFDDFHQRITPYDTGVSGYSVSGGSGGASEIGGLEDNMTKTFGTNRDPPGSTTGFRPRANRTQSLSRPLGSAPRQLSQTSSNLASMPLPSAPLSPTRDSQSYMGVEASFDFTEPSTSPKWASDATDRTHARRQNYRTVSVFDTEEDQRDSIVLTFQSLRAASGAGGSRLSQNLSNSRLPTLKPRNVYSSADRHDETVPPVPAIPKAYESPKEQIEQLCLLNPQKISSYFADDETTGTAMRQNYGMADTLTPDFTSTAGLSTDPPRARREYRHRRGLTVGTGSNADKTPATQHGDKKNLQPLRLPPLNLLPLSTPTAARIALFPAPSAEVDERRTTPPLERSFAKTPNTPMTASKATFFSRSRQDEDDMSDNRNLRSSSSHNALR
ncbi:hypothetical protein B0A49_02263, partial [Cryomyces minteri]